MSNEIKDWVLVPRVATDAMLDAGVRGRAGGGLYGAYIEMIAAAPTPPAEAHPTEAAWFKVCDALDAVDPDWMMRGPVGAEAAADAIRRLATPAEAQVVGGGETPLIGLHKLLAHRGPSLSDLDNRRIHAAIAALSAQPRPYIDMHYGGPIPAPTDKPASAPVGADEYTGIAVTSEYLAGVNAALCAIAALPASDDESHEDAYRAVEALAQQPAAVDGKVIGGGVVLPRYFLDFLLGQGALEGFWFGDTPITEQGPLWWRSRLRALAQPQGEG